MAPSHVGFSIHHNGVPCDATALTLVTCIPVHRHPFAAATTAIAVFLAVTGAAIAAATIARSSTTVAIIVATSISLPAAELGNVALACVRWHLWHPCTRATSDVVPKV